MADNPLGGVIPPQPPIDPKSNVHELKSRLEWGEPAFTIIDVSDRETYNDGHILGAMSMPKDQFVDRVKSSLEPSRDIYIYAETDEETAQAVQQLRAAGYEHVSELKGGLPAWKAIGGPTEGVVESRTPPTAGEYNVVSRLAEQAEMQKREQ